MLKSSPKMELRRRLLEIRENLPPKSRGEISVKICEKFYGLFSERNVFLLYSPIRGEVDVTPLVLKLWEEGKEVYLPAVDGLNMRFCLFEGLRRMEKGPFGVMEPRGRELCRKADVIAVPGVGFDKGCNRLGFGKGFYDRHLTELTGERVGVAYDFQIIESVHPENFDAPLDMIISENRIIRRREWIYYTS